MLLSAILRTISRLGLIFYDLKVDTYYWIPPFNRLSMFFNNVWLSCVSMYWNIYYFSEWVDDVATKIEKVFTEADILSFLSEWLSYAEDAWLWITNAWANVTNIVAVWWVDISLIVKSWIAEVQQWALSQLNNLANWLGNLQEAWSNFVVSILPTLISTFDIERVITTQLKEWFPFYDDLAELWNSIVEFFADPLQWFYDKLDEWFERFW